MPPEEPEGSEWPDYGKAIMKRAAAAVVIAAWSATAAAGASVHAEYPPTLAKAQCPHVLDLPPLRPLDRIRAVLPTLVKRELGDRQNGNGTSYRDWQLVGAISLQQTVPIPVPGAVHWRARAAARCGSSVATRSWLIVLQFPQMHIINSMGRFLIARTRHGWLIWASV